MNEYLMTVSIGPVQGFIAAARRLRDLWFGSYLLSELAKKGAHALYSQEAELIFPAHDNLAVELSTGSDMKAPNKLLAKLTTDEPNEIFKSVKNEILTFWKNELALKTVRNDLDRVKMELFEEQIDDFLEIYGAWVRLDDDYILTRKKADRLLASRKALRNFKQSSLSHYGKGGLPKSSLDGIRESVLKDAHRGARKGGIKKGEELDAVGWVKRYGQKLGEEESLPVFESLSDLAADPFLRGAVRNPTAVEALKDLADAIKGVNVQINMVAAREHRKPLKNISPRILYRSSLQKDIEEAKIDTNSIRNILKKIDKLYSVTGFRQGPLPYTAILLGDGDRVGEAISAMDKVSHRRFSIELDRFARACETIVEKHHGSLIYSGGDDVMAFVPLDMAVKCADALRKEFSDRMGHALGGLENKPTFSIGMAIVHHINPLNMSLNLARQAERLAKSYNGKNALAITLDKRSGAPLEISCGWDEGIADRLAQWTTFHQKELIPDKFGYQLRHLIKDFGGRDDLQWTEDGQPDNALAFEFIRVLQRKRGEQGRNALKEEQLKAIRLTAKKLNRLHRLANELILSRIMAEAKNQAENMKGEIA